MDVTLRPITAVQRLCAQLQILPGAQAAVLRIDHCNYASMRVAEKLPGFTLAGEHTSTTDPDGTPVTMRTYRRAVN